MAQDVGTITQLTTNDPDKNWIVVEGSFGLSTPIVVAKPTIRIVSNRDGTISFQQLVQQYNPNAMIWVNIPVVNEDGNEISKKVRNIFPVR